MTRRTILRSLSWITVALVATACASKPNAPAHQWLPEPSYEGFAADMPKIKPPSGISKEYYPAKSKSQGHYGRVWLGFSVNAQGKAEKISLVQTDFDDLTVAAAAFLRDLDFNVARDWDAAGAPSQRYCMAFMFVLADKPPPPKPQKAETIVITAAHFLPGSVRPIH